MPINPGLEYATKEDLAKVIKETTWHDHRLVRVVDNKLVDFEDKVDAKYIGIEPNVESEIYENLTSIKIGDKVYKGLAGKDGVDGQDGQSFILGNKPPKDSLGHAGDTYLDLDNFNIYYKFGNSWIKKGCLTGKVLYAGGITNKINVKDLIDSYKNFKILVITFYQKDANPGRCFTVTVSRSQLDNAKIIHTPINYFDHGSTSGTANTEIEVADAEVYVNSDASELGVSLWAGYIKVGEVILPKYHDSWITEIIGVN